jgi:hypothetical protein
MAESAAPFIECEQVHAGLAVNDIATAKESSREKSGAQTARLYRSMASPDSDASGSLFLFYAYAFAFASAVLRARPFICSYCS